MSLVSNIPCTYVTLRIDCQVMEYDVLSERLKKTLYYGILPKQDRPSLALTSTILIILLPKMSLVYIVTMFFSCDHGAVQRTRWQHLILRETTIWICFRDFKRSLYFSLLASPGSDLPWKTYKEQSKLCFINPFLKAIFGFCGKFSCLLGYNYTIKSSFLFSTDDRF